MNRSQNMLIGVLFNKKRKKLQSKISQMKNIITDYIDNVQHLNNTNYDGAFVDWDYLVEHYREFLILKREDNFKIFIFMTRKRVNLELSNDYTNFHIYSIIPNSITTERLQIIINNYISETRKHSLRNDIVKKFERQSANFNTLTQIGISLSTIRDIELLLDMILTKSREITNADAGSIYLVEEKIIDANEEKKVTEKILRFVHSQNYSFPIKSPTFTMPLSKSSIVGYVALTGEILNIEDAHKIPLNAGYTYSIETEKKIKVHNRSMITIAMKNQKEETIGVIQLFNKKRNFEVKINEDEVFDREVISFTQEDEEIVNSLASQAAVSLENNILYKEIKTIFEGFIKASVVAIEARDPTTSGHSERVALLTKELGKSINEIKDGIYADIFFTEQDLKVIEYAGLLHDFGKIGVREKVLTKAKKLYPEDMNLITIRYKYLKKSIINDYNIKRMNIINEKGFDFFKTIENEINNELNDKINEMTSLFDIILRSNEPTILEENCGKIISTLLDKKYITSDNEEILFLTKEEGTALMVQRGSLTEQERIEIESHVTHSYKFLCNIPWTKEMSNIPHIAYKHHEKLDGHGYPRGISGENIPIQARMMAIADVYDALTASDRPYKKAVTIEKALNILEMEANSGKIDKELFRIFAEKKVYKVLEKSNEVL